METMSAPNLPNTPRAHTSYVPGTHHQPPRPSPSTSQATRPMHDVEAHGQRISAPASQESFVSLQSVGSSGAGSRLQPSSSNVSQLSQYTDLTSPSSSAPTATLPDERDKSAGAVARLRTPEEDIRKYAHSSTVDYALASPMSVTSPLSVNGAKRTASGHVKTHSISSTPMLHSDRSRRESISSTSSRAGELAASLKTRLGYAMAKVQNGWEHRSIAEVEQLAAHKARHSMSYVDYANRPASSGLSNGTARLSMHDAYAMDGTTAPPSKRHSGHYTGHTKSPYQYQGQHAPRLQPPADIKPTTIYGSAHPQHPHYPSRPHSSHPTHHNTAMSPPRTPTANTSAPHQRARRPPVLRTQTQTLQAERDALDALFQLGSPQVSQSSQRGPFSGSSQANSSQASPSRGEFPTPRRVTFARGDSEGSAAASDSSSSLSAGAVQAERMRTLEGLEAR